ncbi:serine/threonine protein kinase [Candidatus Uabimicrobium amorphum]|uniref:non-specific serine/threonine protein kinase n=1 Tax=Uabimicrobium amorphum TaxID=2596890 RepID=A0A5S9ITX8_UABAM|nr:serine/threonine-protein kinase [Candidatus Uabimicrobium amorphum]BBM88039.1 protein kinase [Candidatus Uabimicrobium amorphum]
MSDKKKAREDTIRRQLQTTNILRGEETSLDNNEINNVDIYFALYPGEVFADRYKVLHKIGEGGMGLVYKVEDLEDDHVIKALKVTIVAAESESEVHIKRFTREINMMRKLHHPNIVTLYEAGQFEKRWYYTMNFIEGKLFTMDTWNDLSVEDGLRILIQIAKAVHHAHQKNILHRDLKPENIIWTSDHQAFLMDFGIAKSLGYNTKLTDSDTVIGSLYYLSPEQASGDSDIDARSDVFALGVVLYQFLTRSLPFMGTSNMMVINAILRSEPISPRSIRSEISEDLQKVCLTALEKNRELRYVSAERFAEDLESVLHDEPPQLITTSSSYYLVYVGIIVVIIYIWIYLGTFY